MFAAPFAVACGGAVSDRSGSLDGGTEGGSPSLRNDAAPISQAADASVETAATPTPDASLCDYCILHKVTWGWNGGDPVFVETSTLDRCLSYTYSRTPVGSSNPKTQTCSTDIANCTGPSISIRDVDDAVENPDVVAALAGSTLLYGGDSRPCDGSVLDIRVDGAELQVGGDCGPEDAGAGCGLPGSCTPVPPGLRALAALLARMDMQELTIPPCSNTFP
jgi:hypothetical protein